MSSIEDLLSGSVCWFTKFKELNTQGNQKMITLMPTRLVMAQKIVVTVENLLKSSKLQVQCESHRSMKARRFTVGSIKLLWTDTAPAMPGYLWRGRLEIWPEGQHKTAHIGLDPIEIVSFKKGDWVNELFKAAQSLEPHDTH